MGRLLGKRRDGSMAHVRVALDLFSEIRDLKWLRVLIIALLINNILSRLRYQGKFNIPTYYLSFSFSSKSWSTSILRVSNSPFLFIRKRKALSRFCMSLNGNKMLEKNMQRLAPTVAALRTFFPPWLFWTGCSFCGPAWTWPARQAGRPRCGRSSLKLRCCWEGYSGIKWIGITLSYIGDESREFLKIY